MDFHFHAVSPSRGDVVFESVLNSPDKEELNWQPVNRALNNPRNEGAELLKIPPLDSAQKAVQVQIVKDVKWTK